MVQTIVPDKGGLWVLVEENATSCSIGPTSAGESGEVQSDGDVGKGPLVLFVTVVGVTALHLMGGS